MDEEEINYRNLRKIQKNEKNNPGLTRITNDYYNSLTNHLENLDGRYIKEENSQRKKIIEDEIKNIKKISTNIYELREKKIILFAISKARGANPDLKNLIDFEKDMYNQILDILTKKRDDLLKHEKNKKGEKKPDDEKEILSNNKPVLLITEDIPEFIGTDKKRYMLKKNDIITLSEDMSNALINKKVAKIIKTMT